MSDHARDHLANERTFLAWVRTSIALLGFGVLIAKLRFPTVEGPANAALPPETGSTWLGLAFAAVGLLTLLFAAVHHERTRGAIDAGDYGGSHRFLITFAAVIFLLGLATVLYLLALTRP